MFIFGLSFRQTILYTHFTNYRFMFIMLVFTLFDVIKRNDDFLNDSVAETYSYL